MGGELRDVHGKWGWVRITKEEGVELYVGEVRGSSIWRGIRGCRWEIGLG